MARTMPSVSGGVSPFELAATYNKANTAYNAALAEQARKANAARTDAITADTEALAQVQTALINNAADITDRYGPTAIGALTGRLARTAFNPEGTPSGLDAGYVSQYSQGNLEGQAADTLKAQMEAVNQGVQGGVRLAPGSLAAITGHPVQSIDLGTMIQQRYGDDSGNVAFRMRDGNVVQIPTEIAVQYNAQGLGEVVPTAATPPPPVTTTGAAPAPAAPAPVPAPAAQPVPTSAGNVQLDESQILVNGQRPSGDLSDVQAPAVDEVLTEPQPVQDPVPPEELPTLYRRAQELFAADNVQMRPDGQFDVQLMDGRTITLTAEEVRDAIVNKERGGSGV